MAIRPEIIKYSCYRRFLEDFYQFKKSSRSGFSFRLFAQRCGFQSPNYLQLIIKGARNLSISSSSSVAEAMQLNGGETQYFKALVQLDWAENDEQRIRARRELLVASKKILSRDLRRDQLEVLNHWYYLLVRELVFLADFQFDAEWVSTKLHGLLDPKQAELALNTLVRAGFLQQSSTGEWQAQDPVIDTGADGLAEERIRQVHEETLKAWAKLLPQLTCEDRELGLINVPIRADKIPELKARLRQFQDELIGWLQNETSPDGIVQIGTYMIKVTK